MNAINNCSRLSIDVKILKRTTLTEFQKRVICSYAHANKKNGLNMLIELKKSGDFVKVLFLRFFLQQDNAEKYLNLLQNIENLSKSKDKFNDNAPD